MFLFNFEFIIIVFIGSCPAVHSRKKNARFYPGVYSHILLAILFSCSVIHGCLYYKSAGMIRFIPADFVFPPGRIFYICLAPYTDRIFPTANVNFSSRFLLFYFIKKIIFNYFKGIYKKLFFIVHIIMLFSKKMLEKIIHKYSYHCKHLR